MDRIVIFDFDGTLFDTADAMVVIFRKSFQEVGMGCTEEEARHYMHQSLQEKIDVGGRDPAAADDRGLGKGHGRPPIGQDQVPVGQQIVLQNKGEGADSSCHGDPPITFAFCKIN